MAEAASSGGQLIYQTKHIVQGEFGVSADPTIEFSTVLGSCVSVCLYDDVAKVGGLNHFLLPGKEESGPTRLVGGVHAMELLINALLKAGAKRERFKAKLFGGARMMEGLSDIGLQNATFAKEFIAREKIECLGESLGGTLARRVKFVPTTGRVLQKLLGRPEDVPVAAAKPAPAKESEGGDLELL